MKSARIELLLASTALGLGLVLCAQPGMAQQPDKQIQASVPMPDVALPAPPTAKDVAVAPADTTKADTAKPESTKPESTKPDAATPATEPAKAASAPTAAPASADATVSDKLRDLITGKKLDRFIFRKADREGAEFYYGSHGFKPLWVSDNAADARAKAAADYIAKVDAVGLNPSDYPLPEFKAGATPDEQAEAELKFTAAILTYARHAQIGQIHFTRVGADISFDLAASQPAEVLAKLADAGDVTAALDSYNPPQEGFKALKKALAELRANDGKTAVAEEEKKPLVKVAEGKILRPGMKDARVVQLRERLNVAGDKSSQEYDNAVFEAVKAFQMGAGIGVDGMLGNGTVKAMNGEHVAGHHPTANPVDIVLANMERWRWLPRKLGNDNGTYVVVNVPDFSLSLFNDDKLFWHTKIVAGMPGKATPMTSAEMKFITVNPTWNVPPSIIEHEYLPALQEDPNALDRIGLKLTQDADGTIHISQPPGAGNALGRIRFNFPNKFLVYQHDTPDKYLFKREKRAYSHGCMRVENPLTYGEKLLSIELPNEHYNEARLEKMFGGSEININFPKPIPVHLTYQTAFVDADGKLQLREDVYGRDAKMIAILKSSERKIADIAVDRAPNTSSKPVRMPVGMYGGSGGGGGGFFDWLTGSSRAQAGTTTYRPRNFIGPSGRYTVR